MLLYNAHFRNVEYIQAFFFLMCEGESESTITIICFSNFIYSFIYLLSTERTKAKLAVQEIC